MNNIFSEWDINNLKSINNLVRFESFKWNLHQISVNVGERMTHSSN